MPSITSAAFSSKIIHTHTQQHTHTHTSKGREFNSAKASLVFPQPLWKGNETVVWHVSVWWITFIRPQAESEKVFYNCSLLCIQRGLLIPLFFITLDWQGSRLHCQSRKVQKTYLLRRTSWGEDVSLESQGMILFCRPCIVYQSHLIIKMQLLRENIHWNTLIMWL